MQWLPMHRENAFFTFTEFRPKTFTFTPISFLKHVSDLKEKEILTSKFEICACVHLRCKIHYFNLVDVLSFNVSN